MGSRLVNLVRIAPDHPRSSATGSRLVNLVRIAPDHTHSIEEAPMKFEDVQAVAPLLPLPYGSGQPEYTDPRGVETYLSRLFRAAIQVETFAFNLAEPPVPTAQRDTRFAIVSRAETFDATDNGAPMTLEGRFQFEVVPGTDVSAPPITTGLPTVTSWGPTTLQGSQAIEVLGRDLDRITGVILPGNQHSFSLYDQTPERVMVYVNIGETVTGPLKLTWGTDRILTLTPDVTLNYVGS
jgi:hypothetical protein